jgi:hypothetical protein
MKKSSNSGQSSNKIATLASKVLRDGRSSTTSKKLAGSVLSQAPNKKK